MSAKAFRETRQRQAIKQAIESMKRPLGPKEILALASKRVPNLGIATVYRNIKAMVEKGELEPVELPGKAPRYQIPDHNTDHVFICEETDKVYTINPPDIDIKSQLPDGFVLDRYQIICYGKAAADEARTGTEKVS